MLISTLFVKLLTPTTPVTPTVPATPAPTTSSNILVLLLAETLRVPLEIMSEFSIVVSCVPSSTMTLTAAPTPTDPPPPAALEP